MPEGDVVFYNNGKENILNGVVDLDNDTLKCILLTGYTPDIDADDVYSSISASEYGTGSGYTAGGVTLGSQVVTQDNAEDEAELDVADIQWVSLGPLTPNTPSHAAIYSSTASDILICYIVLGTTPTNGQNYTLTIDTEGLIHLA